MDLKNKKRMAAKALNLSKKKVRFDSSKLSDIKEAITLRDIIVLIKNKVIQKKKVIGKSRGKTRQNMSQKKKGRSRGYGSRKGTKNARADSKEQWMSKIRTQRKYIKQLKDLGKISNETYRLLYRRCKGGFFRSKRHINLYLTEKNLYLTEKSQ